jgi:hypothetical protein
MSIVPPNSTFSHSGSASYLLFLFPGSFVLEVLAMSCVSSISLQTKENAVEARPPWNGWLADCISLQFFTQDKRMPTDLNMVQPALNNEGASR